MAEKTGRCMCGAVSFVAQNVPTNFGACHCEMCRRWTGSALLEVSVSSKSITWQGEIAKRQSSEWAERAWCPACGTGLYYRVTKEGEWYGSTDIPLGLFDDLHGFELSHEIFIDHKPDSFAYAEVGQRKLTRQECVEKFGLLDGK
ncbi:MAG: GFA family protein [Paracoccaceae bacterium]